jgi:hypothetical protein
MLQVGARASTFRGETRDPLSTTSLEADCSPGEHQRAHFDVTEDARHVSLRMRSADGQVHIEVVGESAEVLPQGSIFQNVSEASAFFESGGVGYSVTASGHRLDGVVLKTDAWQVEPLALDRARSSYFENTAVFPAGSIEFDCALIMRNIHHEWESATDMYV